MADALRCRWLHRWVSFDRFLDMNEYRRCGRCGQRQRRVTPWSKWEVIL